MIVSIVNNQLLVGVKHPKATEVFKISASDFQKIQSWQARLDGREIVDIPTPEIVVPQPTEEELQEQKLQELEKVILRRQALQEMGEDTKPLDDRILEIKGIERKYFIYNNNILWLKWYI